MRRRFVVEAEVTLPPETPQKEVDRIVTRYINDLKHAGCKGMETESIKDEAGQEVMPPWPKEGDW
jgi:hypothetical protein